MAVGFCTGCSHAVTRLEMENSDVVAGSRNVLMEGPLEDQLELRDVVYSETPDGLLQVQVTLVNTDTLSKDPCRLRYRFTWLGEDGLTADSILSDWQDASVLSGDILYLKSVAPNAECRDFRLSMIEDD